MRKTFRTRLAGALRGLLLPVAIVIILLFFFTGVSNLQDSSGDEGQKLLEASIRRAVAACYAAEGIYPPTIEYLENNYGLQVDRTRYIVDYQVFASNLMPDFTVLERSAGPSAG